MTQDPKKLVSLKGGKDAGYNATRKDLHLGRRALHVSMGSTGATVYALFLTHDVAVYIVGLAASLFYILEQVRIHYPEISNKMPSFNSIFLRAEERLKESSAIPYAMSCLLVILSFPKPVAIIALYVLAISDPLAAIVGITRGKHRLPGGKSLEGSAAFFSATFIIVLITLLYINGFALSVFSAAVLIAFVVSALELIPLRIDDNLLIPLYTAVTTWVTCATFHLKVEL